MRDLLDFALHAHGGLERWRAVHRLDVRVSLTGGLYRLKGYPEGVPNVTMRIDARRPAVTGARIAGTLGKLLSIGGKKRGLISICPAGGMGSAAILEGVCIPQHINRVPSHAPFS